MNFDEMLVIRRPSGTLTAPTGVMDLEDGTWLDSYNEVTAKDTGIICQTRCDAQDKTIVIKVSPSGMIEETADVQAFFYIERTVSLVVLGDLCDLTWRDGTIETLTVVQIRRLDGSVMLRRAG